MKSYAPGGRPVTVLNMNTIRETANKARMGNLQACRAISGVVRTTLGPNSANKMMIDPMGGVVITADGHAILREIDVAHPAAKSVLENARGQDEEVGDGTTSVVILTGELMVKSEEFFTRNPVHPVTVFQGYINALDDMRAILDKHAIDIDVTNDDEFLDVIRSTMDTKFLTSYGSIIPRIAMSAARTVAITDSTGALDVDIKRFAKVEKIAGGTAQDSYVLNGIMLSKDLTHRGMRAKIENPRIVLLDSSLEYKKGESQTNVDITEDTEFEALLAQEEAEIRRMCDFIISAGCDLVITEKGVSDLAQHFLMKEGISVIRRVKKTDNNRIARVTGATIVNRLDELKPKHVGTKAKMFKVDKIGDEYYSFISECDDPGACTIVLRGGSKDSLNDVERSLLDALHVARNLILHPKVLPGAGAIEMAVSVGLNAVAPSKGLMEAPYRAVASAFEVIPKTLLENCGADVIRKLTELRAIHNSEQSDAHQFGVNGRTGDIVNALETKIWDPYAVKLQCFKAALECAAMILRIDDVLAGVSGGQREVVSEVTNHQMQENMNMD